MSESEEGKVVEGGLVVSMRPQVSVELNSYGGVVISTASISDDFRNVDHNDVRFPAECAREIADELYRLTGGAPAPARTENEKRADVISQPTGRDGHQQDEDGEKYPF